ncbi:hypothetical protein DRQ36_04490 [bacterium]|nr:MAG: hypothetical protein DRQ36_04490 [bacterium]
MNENETPRERFKRIATQRVSTVLQRLDILGNCSNKQYYEYNDEDVEKIFNAIKRKVRDIERQFVVPKEEEFKL